VSGLTVVASIEPTTGKSTDTQYPGEVAQDHLDYSLSVSGKQLIITINSGEIHQNNLVDIVLDASLANTAGVLLGENYEFSFTTSYTPLYCSVRRVRLMAGQYLAGIPDDTLNLAIHLASLEADERTWNKSNIEPGFYNFVRSEWSCCRAAQYLLSNVVGGPGRPKMKKLGDLTVEYDTTVKNVQVPLDRIQACLDKWDRELTAGGKMIQNPSYSVKGEWDIDRPNIGRQWLHVRDWLNTQTPAANMRVRPLISRRWRGVYGNRGWWER
jgi:hypothetical protein